jgi:hypothetical protein
MALFHSTTKIITRSDGGNAVAAAAYRSGTRMTCARTGQVFNYTRKKEVTYRAILAPPNSPDWLLQRERLSNAIEAVEKSRVNAQLWREVEVALPVELTPEQHIQLLNEYVQEQFVAMGMVADICLHDKRTDRGGNPHAHILLTLREITPTGFGAKRRDWNDKALVTQWREAWATACNKALAESGSTERIDHRSNKARGIDAPATVHTGRRTPWNSGLWDAKAEFNAWVQTSIELAKVQAEVKKVQSQIIDLTSTLAQAIAERDAAQRPQQKSNPIEPKQRIWTPAAGMPPTDLSIERLLAKRKQVRQRKSALASTESTPPTDVSHGSDGLFKGDKPC